jgi:hypothetical protein
VGAAPRDVRCHVVQLAELGSEGDVAGIVEAGVAEYADPVLVGKLVSISREYRYVRPTLFIAARISAKTSFVTGLEKSMPLISAPNVGWSSLMAM